MQQTGSSFEKGSSVGRGAESGASLIVTQPHKMEVLLETLSLIDKISERVGEDRSGDMGGGGAQAGGKGDDGTAAATARDKKLANLPAAEVMRTELKKHIDKEVKQLQREIRKATRRLSRPGAAYRLSLLYARIRRLNTLISDLVDAAYDVIKRLFIRVVIDGQKVM